MSVTTNPKAMRAWTYTSASQGLEKSVKLVEDASPPFLQELPADGILVKVRYSALNPADHKIPELGLLGRVIVSVPATPGLDFAGVVVRIGDAIPDDAFLVGDQVFGRIAPGQHGTLGEYVCARMDGCAVLPKGVSLEDASCIGTAGQTAYQCIVPNVKEGDKVFINGGSGGTGTFGIQIAKAVGCFVTVSCSAKNADLCRSLGADEIVDYTTEDVSQVLKSKGPVYKLVVDNVGSSPRDLFKAADHFLLPDGKFVQIGAGLSFGDITATASRMMLPTYLGGGKSQYQWVVTENHHEHLEKLGNWMKEGKIKVIIDEVFEYAEVPKAVEFLKKGHLKGKIVVRGCT
ncbi:reticulon-4-interacting protein 1, mitochondrial precursor [Hypoxylon fragiforme]|uniref:reticulon-4-interacting protein 1, mitochondrial precursor n=1 Tax=Hypoxylon fragiforme TaxID=63214 RepID=UPI0020C603EA|nr:reticulon-4-interacting protein 1, mitochondrial precursor [Hypoxylon fragiforme]KAI2604525.1 reticulon-4-interacting protein 1, mitochondrial precursor [Hypoxylon fragiforme]